MSPLRSPKKRVKNKKKKPFRLSTLRFFSPRVLSPARPAPPAIGRGTSGCRFSVLVLKGFQKKKCPATITIIRGPKICLLGKKEVFCGNLFRFRFPTKSSLEDSHSARVRVAPKRCLAPGDSVSPSCVNIQLSTGSENFVRV